MKSSINTSVNQFEVFTHFFPIPSLTAKQGFRKELKLTLGIAIDHWIPLFYTVYDERQLQQWPYVVAYSVTYPRETR